MVKRNTGRDHGFVTAAPCLRHISRRWVYCTSSNDLRRKRVCEKTNKFVFKRIPTLISAFSSRNSHIRPSFQSFLAFPRTKRCAFLRSISQAALDFGFSRHRNIDFFALHLLTAQQFCRIMPHRKPFEKGMTLWMPVDLNSFPR